MSTNKILNIGFLVIAWLSVLGIGMPYLINTLPLVIGVSATFVLIVAMVVITNKFFKSLSKK